MRTKQQQLDHVLKLQREHYAGINRMVQRYYSGAKTKKVKK